MGDKEARGGGASAERGEKERGAGAKKGEEEGRDEQRWVKRK